MNVIVSNKIIIDKPNNEIVDYCKNSLVLANPEYYKKERMGLWIGNTPKNISLFEKDGDTLIIPFGCLQDIWGLVGNNAQWMVEFADLRRVNYDSRINLYPYQEKAVNEAISAKNGVIVMPCGAGKTQTALELISRIGGKTLWLTHTQDLLQQSINRAKSVLNISHETYGKITAGKVNIGSGITFATVQTMSKIDLENIKNTFDVIIVDEVQHCCGSPTRVTQFYKVLSNLSARYKIGLTATPKRADGLERSMFALLGDIICKIPKEAVKNTTCPIKIQFIETHYMPNYDIVLAGDGTINYSSLVEDLTHNQERFKFVLETIEKLPFNSPTLVLGNRVEYLQQLNKEYCGRSNCLSGMGQSRAAKEERKRALTALNEGDIDCLFATYQLAKEGLDVPNLRYVVFATPEKEETTIIQSAGRVGRKAGGKKYGTVIDFVDDFGMYRGWCKKRKKYYKKIDAEVI